MQLHRASLLRYGENPHQEAAAYIASGHSPWWARATQVQGKQMSFNNYRDADAAWRLVLEYEAPTAAVIKHMNPSGVASRPTLRSAFQGAWDCDPGSAYGSVVAVNQDLDSQTADLVADHFVEVLIAPSASPDVLELLADRPRLRVLVAPPLGNGSLEYHEVDGGFLVQGRDRIITERDLWKVVSERAPSEREWTDLVFAWKVCGHVKSNAIVVANGETAVGIGGGDQSRVGAARRALDQAGQHSAGGVAASDAFLPFRDALDDLAAAGVGALVQPGGSRRDDEVIAAADTHGMSVVFTGRRHFRH